MSMPILKIDMNTGSLQNSNNQQKMQKIAHSTQKTPTWNERLNINQQATIEKFNQQAQQLKEIKKTICSLSHSRLSSMKRLKIQTLPQCQSINLYRLSQPQTKSNIFNSHKKKKVAVNLKLTNRDQQKQKHYQQHIQQDHLQNNIGVDVAQQQPAKNSYGNEDKIKVEQNVGKKEDQHQEVIISGENNSLPRSSLKKQRKKKEVRSLSATQLKTVSNLASIYKKQKLLNFPSNTIFLLSNSQKTPMDLKNRYQERLKQSRAKIMSSKVKLIQSQTNFKLEKKIKENLHLIEKQQTLHELIHKRMERERQQAEIIKRKNQQKRLIHESRKMKVSIQRIYKREIQKQDKQFNRSRSQQTLLNVAYNRFNKEKKDIEKQQLLASRMQFLKNLNSVDFKVMMKINNPQNDFESMI